VSDTFTAEALAAAREYFRQPEPRFWTWSDDAISWTDGTTIVFYRELAEILRRLAIDGLPALTPLLLVLAACRDSYRRERVREALEREGMSLSATISDVSLVWEDGLAILDQIAALPADLRSSLDGKVALLETVFAGRRSFPVKDALSAAELLSVRSPEELLVAGAPVASRPHVSLELLGMNRIDRLDVESLRLRMRTGLEQLVEPTELEPPDDESLRAFISRLRDDPELSGLGRLAHNLLAAVQVPRAVSEPEDLRLGGVSDIANRGPLDRLLVSELAHDDLTLAVRVAVGEALYLRREAPPRTPVRERCLLIDCGIRLWGVPRVFAAAVGLALAATADQPRSTRAPASGCGCVVSAWRPLGDVLETADLGTREGLIAHLGKLEPAPHPAAALPRFFETIDRSAATADAILITHEDVLADGDFRRALAELGDRPCYLATVDRSGRFRLSLHSGRGMKLIREAQFDLDRILAPARKPATPLLRQNGGSDLPVILSMEPFPLLLPHQVNPERLAVHREYGAVTVSHDRRLMHWRRAGHAAAQLSASVPRGTLHHLSIDDEGVVRLVAGGGPNSPLRFLHANLVTGSLRVMTIHDDFAPTVSVVFEQQVLYLIGKHAIRAVNDDGQTSPAFVGTFNHAGRRFFKSSVWEALSFDGQSPQLTRVPIHSSIGSGSIAAMFDIQGRDGPYVITHSGRIASTVDGGSIPYGFQMSEISVVAISHDGQRIIVRMPDRQETCLLEIVGTLGLRLQTHPIARPAAYLFHPELYTLVRAGSLPYRFHQIGIDRDGRLALVGRRGRAVHFSHNERETLAELVPAPGGDLRQVRSFVPAEGPPDVGYQLRVACWADGSRAWLDSRGLLHLKSSDRNLPELTLVLVHSGEQAAWSSDGRLWGPTFYTGIERSAARPGQELLTEIDAFLARLR
jgi:hypothetical protein